MPIEDIDPGTSPEAPGNWYFYKQGSATSTGVTISSEGDITAAGTITAGKPTPAWYNVKTYGAVGDGVTNDRTAILAAIAAIPATGGTLYFPAGTYAINGGAIELTSYIRVTGDGVRASRVIQNSTTANAFHATDVSYVTIENLRINGPGSGTGNGIFIETTAAPNNYITIRNVNVQTFGGDGVSVQRSIVSLIEEVVSQGNGGHGFNINDGTSMNIIASYGLSNQQAGFNLLSMAYCALTGCGADSNGIGYLLDTSQGTTLSGCGCEVPVNRSVSYPGIAYKITGGFSNSLINCVNYDNLLQAVLVTGSSVNNTIINFDENSPTGTATASIQVDSGSRATIIAPNVTTATVYTGNVTTLGGLLRNEFFVSGSTIGVRATTLTGSGSNTQPIFQARGVDSSNFALTSLVTTDAASRFAATVAGALSWGDGTNARDTTLSRTAANVLGVTTADLAIATAGKGLQIKTGSNAKMGEATLVGGTVTVANTSVTANSLIFMSVHTQGGTQGILSYTRSTGVSFTINSTNAADTSTVIWMIVEPA